ncbi:MAG: hypothetical protein ACREBB_06250 [Nitrosotalea sp.]
MVKQEALYPKDVASDYSNLSKLLQVEKTPKLVTRLTDLLSIVSKDDALTIFLSAKNGLASELDTPQKIGLTKKQYYTRLKQLVEFGLLSKNENKYTHTALGDIIYNKHILGLLHSVKISKELEMIDLLKKSSKFKSEEITTFVSKLNPEMNLAHDPASDMLHSFVATTEFDSMVRKVTEMIELAKQEIILVTRFQNELIINAILKKAEKGIQIKIISDVSMVENYFKSEKDKIRVVDKNSKELINVVSNPFYPSKIERRYSKTPYCMLIVDQKQIGVEIVDNYKPNTFKMAIFGTDASFSSQMKNEFENMWESAVVNPPQIKQLQ